MKRIRYLTLLWMLLCGIIAKAQFNPANPAEPGQLTSKLVLNVSPSGAGSVSGGGDIIPGTSVTVSASAYTGWKFVKWTNSSDTEVSTNNSYTFTKASERETLTAHFEFDPNSPSEPSQLPYKLTLIAEDGGSVSGGGFYLPETVANITAHPNSYYYFDGWYYPNGTCFSTDASTAYTMGDGAATLIAKFKFNPDSPAEPGEVNGWRLKLKAQEGGTVSADKYTLKEGETTTVRANVNSGYQFVGWYNEESLVSENAVFEFTMGDGSVTLEARFQFNPSSPGEPDQIKQRKFSFMLRGVITKPEAALEFPILLTPLATLHDMTFQLNFDNRLNVDVENVILAGTTTPYTVTREVMPPDADLGEGYTSYKFTLTDGSIEVEEEATPTVIPILTFPVSIPSDIETATSYKISINQISMTLEDESTQTAGTRNGRLYVYKNGDVNGDDVISITDAVSIVNYIMGNPSENFIEEVANVNDEGEVSITDAVGVVNIIMDNGASMAPKMVSEEPQ